MQVEVDNPRDVIDAHDLGIAGGYIIEAAMQKNIDRLKAENDKLRKWCNELLCIAETHYPEWFHWPEVHDELTKLGVVIVDASYE